LLRIIPKYISLEPKGGFEIGSSGFCLGFPGKLTNLNSITPSFWKINGLNPAA
jgi:hypothetical protein